jgi:hypothetical protein
METANPAKSLIPRQIKPENIGFSGAKSPATMDESSKLFRWDLVTAGNCSFEGVLLEIDPGGWAHFWGNLSSSGSDDSWGILRFNFRQSNGLVLWASGSFWSPTIGNWGPWHDDFQYPAYLFDTIALVDFDSHC